MYLSIRDCNQDHYVYCDDPSELNLAFENVTFTSQDQFQIPAWYIPSTPTDLGKHVILVHGRGADRHEGMRYAQALHDAGFNILALDLRHPRQRPDIISSMGYHEKKDVLAAVDYLIQHKQAKHIGIMGFSMGAATSVLSMANDERIQAGIFNGGFANVSDVLADNGKSMYGLPRYPLIPLVMQLFEWRADLDMEQINPEDFIGQIAPRPVYVMHGTADKTVGFHHAQRLYAAANEPKSFWQVEGGEHTRLWQADRMQAENRVTEFFRENL